MIECLETLASLSDVPAEHAVTLLAAAEAERARIGVTVPPRRRAACEEQRARLEAEMGEDPFHTTWQTARSGGLTAGLNAVLGPAPAPLPRTPPPFRAAVPTY